jgi:hypothetical protein
MKAAAVAIGLFLLTQLASASLIPMLSSVTGTPGDYLFTYTAVLSVDEMLNPGSTTATSDACPAPGGGNIDCNPAGTFLTLYDFNGYDGTNSAPTDWTLTTQLTGVTPSAINGADIDLPGVTNLTWMYTGPVVQGDGLTTTYTFTAGSVYGLTNPDGNYSAQLTKTADGSTDQITGPVSVPMAPVPEPGTLFAMGGGLGVLGLLRRRAPQRRP